MTGIACQVSQGAAGEAVLPAEEAGDQISLGREGAWAAAFCALPGHAHYQGKTQQQLPSWKAADKRRVAGSSI